jgi:hypothetical protein
VSAPRPIALRKSDGVRIWSASDIPIFNRKFRSGKQHVPWVGGGVHEAVFFVSQRGARNVKREKGIEANLSDMSCLVTCHHREPFQHVQYSKERFEL